MNVVVQGLCRSTTGGSLSSTPPVSAGAYTGPPSTHHHGAFDPVFALGSFIIKEFRNEYTTVNVVFIPSHVTANRAGYLSPLVFVVWSKYIL